MRKATLPLVLLFTLLVNHAAFLNWFQDDDLDNLSWAPVETLQGFTERLVSVKFYRDTFRPTGHIMYHVLGRTVRLNYAWYEAWLLAGHLLNIALLWRLMRKLGLDENAAASGTLFFAFHQACFFAYWRPMYVFDVACALFCLLSLHAYIKNRWVVSLLLFWIAYRAKELAVMLPIVLLAWEWWFGDAKIGWKRFARLAPFFAVSASFGLQAICVNHQYNDPYSMHATPAAIWDCVRFYSGKLLFPYSALLLLPLPLLFRRDRRIWLGVLFFWALLTPMLMFPGRQMAVYIYLPLAGAGIVLASLASYPRLRMAVFAGVGVWLALCVGALVKFENTELRASADNRTIARAIQQSTWIHPEVTNYVFEDRPSGFKDWGISGALSIYIRARTGQRPDVSLKWTGILDPAEFSRQVPTALIHWDDNTHQARILPHLKDTPDWAYLKMDPGIPLWQLLKGWQMVNEGGFRWASDHAETRLYRPVDAGFLELQCDASQLVHRFKSAKIGVKMGDVELESRVVTTVEPVRLRWDLKPVERGGSVPITIDVDHTFSTPPDTRRLALKVTALGFR